MFLAAEEGEKVELVGGFLAEWAWLIPVVPLVAAAAIVFFGKRLPYKGWELAVGALGFVAVYGTALLIGHAMTPMGFEDHVTLVDAGTVPGLGDLVLEWGWTVDGLSIMMYFLVGVVGFFVFTYAKGYMEGDVRFTWFFAAFTLFAGTMLVLVSAPNMIQLIVGWEGVGLSSYLLIGHYWEDMENVWAGNKAFITNKIADIGLFLGVIVFAIGAGSFRFLDVFEAVESGAISSGFAVAGALLIFLGAMGKSGQFPLHVWLPDAMAGPTPVSSLMHAATMVTAGVYLIARMFPVFDAPAVAGDIRWLLITIGVITLFATGLIALVQDDIKKVLAYSTLSQLGYMTAAVGAGAYTAGLFHLFTHAFFKALLFLAAGSVIHAVHSNNMSDMGGLRSAMPHTFRTFVIGSLALAGILPFAGFWSKDEILATLNHDGYTAALVVATAGAFVTAFYMGRAVFLTFFGEYRGQGQPHESPPIMTVPLYGLAAGAVFFGFLNVPGLYTGFTDWVTARVFVPQEYHPESIDFVVGGIGLLVALAGIAAAYVLFFRDAESQAARDRFSIPVLYPILENKYFIDDFYMKGIINPTRLQIAAAVNWSNDRIIDFAVNAAGVATRVAARFVYDILDQLGIDFGINAAGAVTGEAGGALRLTQTGKVQQYAAVVVAGAVLLAAGFIIFA